MADVITRLRLDTDEFQNRARRASSSFNDMSQQLEDAKNKIALLNSENLKLSGSFGKMQTVSTTLRGKISELSEAYLAAAHHYNMLDEAGRKSQYGQNMLRGMEQLRQRVHATRAELQGLEAGLNGKKSGAGFGSRFAQGLVPGLGMGAGAAGAMAAVKAVGLLKDVTVDAVKTNMDFEQSNANLAAILGKTSKQIGLLTENAKALGGSTKFTASEITELQTVLARRGFGQEQIIEMTHGITNLSLATGTDLAQSAELAAATMQAFGMKATEMDKIVSTLGVSTTKSALTTEALGTSLQYVAPTARAAGFSLEDTVAMLGTLVDNGINASTAGTSLRQIFLGMSTSSGKLAKALGGPVNSFEDFVAALRRMKEEGGDSIESISKAVRVTALPAFLALVNNADRLDELKESITDVDEELQKMADTQMNTAKGATIILKSAWEGLMLTFSESNGILKDTVEMLTRIVNKYKDFRNLRQGGQAAVNASIGDSEAFRKDTEQKAKNFIQDWNNNQMAATMRGGGESGMVAGTGFGIDGLGVAWSSNKSEYESAFDEAAAKLKEQKALYEKLIPLSEQYAKYQDGAISPKTQAAIRDWGEGRDAKSKIEELTGSKFNYEGFQSYLTNMYRQIKMYEAVVNMNPANSETPVVADAEDQSDQFSRLLATIKNGGDPHAEEAARIKARYEELIAELDRESMSEREYTTKVYDYHDQMYDELVNLYKDDAKHQNSYLEQKAKNTSRFNRDIYKIGIKEQKAAIEMEAKNEVEALKKNEMGEREYADKVYEIRKKMFEKLIELYATSNPTKADEYRGQLATLTSSHQGSQRPTAGKVFADYSTGVADAKDYLGEYIEMAKTASDENQKAWATGQVIEYAKEVANASTQIQKIKNFKSIAGEWQKGWSGIASSVDAVTDVVDTLRDAIEGNASAWDVMKATMNSVFTIMESVCSVMETVNTLTEIGRALSQSKSEANLEEAATLGIKAGASGAVAGAEAGESVASIPYVGPILAVAAIASVAAAIGSMFKKTEYHANGGFIGGPRGTDITPMWGTPGELVLNRAQQNNLAGQLAGSARGGFDGGNVQFVLRGTDLIGSINSTVSTRGGNRNNKIYQH